MDAGSNFGSRYVVREEVGRGPVATVYRADDLERNQTVALKLLTGRYTEQPRFAVRFRERMRAIAALSHPNLVSIYDYGSLDGQPYLAEEWVAGVDLGRRLASRGPLSSSAAVGIARPVGRALTAVHRAGLAHGGLKPSNVLLTGDGQVKVSDAGLAGIVSESGLSHTSLMASAAGYLSPEQAEGGQPDARSDVYSLGVILFEMLAGRLPFEADDVWSLVAMHAGHTVPSPRSLNSQVPEPLAQVVVRSLQKLPEDRYASAADFEAALAAAGKDLTAPAFNLFGSGAGAAVVEHSTRAIQNLRQSYRAALAVRFALGFAVTFLVLYVLSGSGLGATPVSLAAGRPPETAGQASVVSKASEDEPQAEADPEEVIAPEAVVTPAAPDRREGRPERDKGKPHPPHHDDD